MHENIKEAPAGSLQLTLEHATFTRQNQVIFSGINWQLQPHEQWVIYGPVGAGKTSLLAALAGQLPLKTGGYELQIRSGEETSFQVVDRNSFRRHTALVTFQQQPSFFNYGQAFYQQRYQSLESEIAIPTVQEVLQQAANSTPAEIEAVARQMQLRHLLPLTLIKLSNGQTRKLHLARTLLQKPKLLILDNPFTGLDVQAREELKNLINGLITQGNQILLATNQPDIPEKMNQVLWLDNFQVVGTCSREQFFKNVANSPRATFPHNSPAFRIKLPLKPEPQYQVVVCLENVRVQYQEKVILDNINWTVKKGEKWALVGPNGSGKSTLLSLIYADNPQAFANKIWLFDKRKGSGESIWEIKKRIGYVSPELHLYFRQPLTGQQVAATGYTDTLTRPRQLTDQQTQHLQEHFAFFHRTDLMTKPFLQLSAGEQRLILLIRSVIKNPELLIWDEPFQGLSPEYIAQATALLEHYCQGDTTLILVSHYAHEIPVFVSNYLCLELGRVKNTIDNR